jgi:hypothetical protein
MTAAVDTARQIISSAQTKRAELIRKIAAEQRELHDTELRIAKAQKIIERSKPITEQRANA